MAVIRIDEGAIRKFATGPEVRALMLRAGDAAHRSIAAEVAKHRVTGAYVAGLQRPSIDGRCVVKITNTDKKAVWLEQGTRAHVINGHPWLYWKGARHPVRSVNHPGTPAYKPMETGLRNAKF